jgi:hypothetical protein
MEHFVGLNVSQELTHLCVIDGQGKTVWQGRWARSASPVRLYSLRSPSRTQIPNGMRGVAALRVTIARA